MYKHLSRLMRDLIPSTVTLPMICVYLFQDINTVTLISSHCPVQWVGAIRHTRSSFWKIKAGLPAEPSLISKGRLSYTVTMDEYLFWVTLSKFATFIWLGQVSFFLPATFINLWNFPVISGTKTWGWPVVHYGQRFSNTCMQWQKQLYHAWLLYSSISAI